MKTPDQQAAALRMVQWRGNRAIDRAYAGVGAQVRDAVLAASVPGPDGPVLTEAGKRAAAANIAAIIETVEPSVVQAILAAIQQADAAGLGGVSRD